MEWERRLSLLLKQVNIIGLHIITKPRSRDSLIHIMATF